MSAVIYKRFGDAYDYNVVNLRLLCYNYNFHLESEKDGTVEHHLGDHARHRKASGMLRTGCVDAQFG